jgi:hypothetical protein
MYLLSGDRGDLLGDQAGAVAMSLDTAAAEQIRHVVSPIDTRTSG